MITIKHIIIVKFGSNAYIKFMQLYDFVLVGAVYVADAGGPP
jgi:hypothetical protein